MRCRIIKTALSGITAAAIMAASVWSVSAADVSVPNNLFETDYWSDGGAWTIDADWDGGATAQHKVYADDSADAPASGSTKALNVWHPNGGTTKAYQTVTIPEGTFEVTFEAMGADTTVELSIGSAKASVETDGWNSWKSNSFKVTGTGAEETVTFTATMKAGGYAYIDGLTIKEVSDSSGGDTGSGDDSGTTDDSGDSGSTDSGDSGSTDSGDSEKVTPADDGKTDDTSKSEGSGSADASNPTTGGGPAVNTVANGDFEAVSDTELIGWEVEWPDGLSLWYANDTDKSARADKNNNYLTIWNEKACALSLKQTVHLTPGTYKVTFNMDANEDVDTGVKLTVGDLTAYTLPKGVGWEKWAACETDTFTVSAEGDYVLAFTGDLAADTWLALDNIAIVNADGTPADGNGGNPGNGGNGGENNGQTGSTAAGALALAAASIAAMGIVAEKKRK